MTSFISVEDDASCDGMPYPAISLPSHSLRGPLIIGVSALAISLGGLLSWSFLATIASAVIVPGTVVVDTGRKYVQHLDGGILKSIDVQEGQAVVAKQLLMRFDSDTLEIALGSLKRLLAMNVGAQIRLNAEQDELSSVTFPEQAADIDQITWTEVKQEQLKLFNSRRLSLLNKMETLKSDGAEAIAAAGGVQAQIVAQRVRINLTLQELATAQTLAKSGWGTRQRVLEISRSLAALQSEVASLWSREIDTRQIFQHDLLEVKQQTASFIENASVDLQQMKKEQAELLLKLKTVERQIAALSVLAPVSGRVVNMTVHTLGGVVAAGATILEIVPKTDVLVVEAEVRPDDIEDVSEGQSVDIRIAGFKGQQLPKLVGVVTRISADRIEDPQRGVSFFRVRAQVSQVDLIKSGSDELKPGIAVTLMIRKGNLSPIQYLVLPFISFFSRALR